MARLQARGADVFLVSGGFRAIIDPIADLLRIPRDHVFANTILFQAPPEPGLSCCTTPLIRAARPPICRWSNIQIHSLKLLL